MMNFAKYNILNTPPLKELKKMMVEEVDEEQNRRIKF